jgi:uncharacterized protein YxjI
MNYPVTFTFKILALASQIYVRDASGSQIGYVKQKLLKLKEDINVFRDDSQSSVLFNIKADRVIDFSARYNFTDSAGRGLGAIKRQGMRSIWRANYEIEDASGRHSMTIREENGWVKVLDGLIGEIPIIGMFTGYLLNPSYILTRTDGTELARLAKTPAFFEGKFQLDRLGSCQPDEETLIVLAFLTMTLLERARG